MTHQAVSTNNFFFFFLNGEVSQTPTSMWLRHCALFLTTACNQLMQQKKSFTNSNPQKRLKVYRLTNFRGTIKAAHQVRSDIISTSKHSITKVTKLQHIFCLINLQEVMKMHKLTD